MSDALPSAPVRYGVIGTGMMGCEHILNLNRIDDAEIVALSDPDEDSRALGAACVADGLRGDDRQVDAPSVAVYDDHRALLERDDLDAVVIASPNFTHRSVLDDVLATDLHVMVEKPLCTTVGDAMAVRELARGRTRDGRPALAPVLFEQLTGDE